ncbi:MAG: FAD-binding oxidoreductase [Candidatus Cybelea sp.]
MFDISDWPGHVAGQHVVVSPTMPDGTTPARAFSIGNAPVGTRVELTIELFAGGAVSPYLVNTIAVGDTIEVMGPIGGWFVWHPEQIEPVQLIAGGSGIVPLMAMIRTRRSSGSQAPFRLLYSARSPESVYYRGEFNAFSAELNPPEIALAYTRTTPPNSSSPRRIDGNLIAANVFPAERGATAYVCGPVSFVEAVSALLTDVGYATDKIRFERFAPSGSG